MNNNKIIVIAVLVLLVFGGWGMMSLGNGKVVKQQGETQDQMMERMHPSQGLNDDSNKDMGTIEFNEAVGKIAPDFTLNTQKGSTFKLSDYKNKTVVLFFSGGAMCYPACWDQIEALGSDERFNNENVITASIVVDSKEKWDQIIASQPKFGVGTILIDTNKAVSNAYSMLQAPSSMHKGKFPGHTYLIIKDGVVSYMLDDPKMAINTDELASKL